MHAIYKKQLLKSTILAAGVTAALSSVQTAAHAEDAVLKLDEIVVTAQKREQSLQDTPVAVTAISAEGLEMRGVETFDDVSKFTPNLTVSQQPGSGNTSLIYSLRGANTNDVIITAETAVAVYIDGVYAAKSMGSNFDLVDLERLEVLRGPQGTLFGRNSTGGAVVVTTKKPSGEFGGKITASGGSDNLRGVKGSLDLPAFGEASEGIGRIAVKLSGMYRERDGLFENTTGNDLNDLDRHGYRLALNWQLGDKFTFDYSYDDSQSREGTTAFQITRDMALAGGPFDAATAFISPTRLDTLSMAPVATLNDGTPFQSGLYSNGDVSGHNFTAQYDFGNFSLKWITGIRKTGVSNSIDLDASPLPIAQFTLDYNLKQTSHELQLNGSASDGAFNYVAGLYTFKEHGEESALQHLFGGGQENKSVLGVKNSGQAIYGQIEWNPQNIADGRLTIIAGARYSKDKRQASKDITSTLILQGAGFLCDGGQGSEPCVMFDALPGVLASVDAGVKASNPALGVTEPGMSVFMPGTFGACTAYSSGLPINFGGFPTGSSTPPGLLPCMVITGFNATHNLEDQGADDDFLSTTLGLQYRWGEDINSYLKYSTSYRSPGFNGRAPAASLFGQAFEREKMEAWELGVKSQAFDDRLRYNLAVFYSDYSNRQTNVFIPSAAGSVVINAGRTEFWGAEVEATALLTENLTVNLAYSWLDGNETIDAATVELLTGVGSVGSGGQLIHAPEHTLAFGVQWDQDLPVGALSARVDMTYTSTEYLSPGANTLLNADNGHTLVDARLVWRDIEVGSSQFDLSIWAKNLFDTEYRTMGIDFSLFLGNNYGNPRTFGADLSLKF